MKLKFKPVLPKREPFNSKDERFAGFDLLLSSDRRGSSEKAWGRSKDPKADVKTPNELKFVNTQTELTIVGWSGFTIGMLDPLKVSRDAFEVDEAEIPEGETIDEQPIDFEPATLSYLLSQSTEFDKHASAVVQRYHGNEIVDEADEEKEEADRKNS